jgi:UDP-N-acetylmuramyl pentapeptide phosphotransferase/UDP-N-acetylglucosamine-1-phosphate transferase
MTPAPSPSVAAQLGCGLLFAAATALGALLLVRLLRPVLQRYALARPNARSAHRVPTPQGGGLAVLGAVVPAACLGAAWLGAPGPAGLGSRFALDVFDLARLWTVLGAAVLVGAVGVVDDIRPLPPLPRLALQIIAMGLAVSALPDGARLLPWMPLVLERFLLVVGGAWFVNLTNFMDGMDWLTVADAVPATAALSLFWSFGFLSPPAGLAMLALLGGLLGFAPFNRPVARLFLGDVGSLAIGLLLAYGLFDLAAHGGLAAAVLLVLYPIADSGITLAWRLRRGDRVWEAHRQHFYQVATARGLTVREVLQRVLVTNVALAAFAGASLWQGDPLLSGLDVVLGAGAVALLLRDLARGRPEADAPRPGRGG